jgi:hypothetical protein
VQVPVPERVGCHHQAAGFSILTIFQHENSDPETFLDKIPWREGCPRSPEDLPPPTASLPGSAIYFAVDGVDQTIKDSVFEWRVNKGQVVQAARKKRLLTADPVVPQAHQVL